MSCLEDQKGILMQFESGHEERLEQLVEVKKLAINKLLKEETDVLQKRTYRDAVDVCDDYLCGVTCINCFMHDMYHMKLLYLFKDGKELFPEEWRFYIDVTTVDPSESLFLKCQADKL